jgi:hypothetical protein
MIVLSSIIFIYDYRFPSEFLVWIIFVLHFVGSFPLKHSFCEVRISLRLKSRVLHKIHHLRKVKGVIAIILQITIRLVCSYLIIHCYNIIYSYYKCCDSDTIALRESKQPKVITIDIDVPFFFRENFVTCHARCEHMITNPPRLIVA